MIKEAQSASNGQIVVVNIPMKMKTRGGRRRIIIPDLLQQKGTARGEYQESMALAIARAHLWKELIDSGKFASISDLASAIGIDPSYAARMFRLTMLAPDIIDAVLSGNEPEGVTMRKLARPIPIHWHEQRTVLGFEAREMNRGNQ